MIRFMSDWQKIPSAIPDWSTTNTGFLRYVATLQKMGIKNHHWPLALHNPSLQGLDPFSPDLTFDQMKAIKIEAEYNPWYYFRECLRIPPSSGEIGAVFRANRANMSMLWSYMCHVDYMLIQPRQTGKSITSYGLYSWLLYFRYTNSRISLVTKSSELRSETTGKVRSIREYLPAFLTIDDKNDTIADERVTYNTRKNILAVAVSRNDKSGANKVGRGNTSPTVGWDESPFINFIEIAYKAAMPGMNAAIKDAAALNIPYGTILTTTAGDQSSRDGKFIYKMWSESARWSEHFLDVDSEEELKSVVRKNCKESQILINGTWGHRQVGLTDLEHYENMSRARAKGPEADRDFFNIWTADSTQNPLDKNLLARAVNSQRYSDYSEVFKGGYVVHWYLPQSEVTEKAQTMQMVVGADTSEGVGRDNLTLIIVDPFSLEVIGTSVINETLIPKYAEFLGAFMLKYKKALFIPERKSTGQTFIDYLCIILHSHGIDPFRRIWNTIIQNKDVDKVAFMEINGDISRRDDAFYVRRKTKFGFCTGTTTRRTLYEDVINLALKKGASRMNDAQLISEVTGLIEKNGRLDHEDGKHDDTVIAWLLCSYLLFYGNNLDYYGLDSRRVLTRALEDNVNNDEADNDYEAVTELQNKIEATLEEFERADGNLALKLEGKLRFMVEMLDEYGVDTVNIGGKIDELNEARLERFNDRYYR